MIVDKQRGLRKTPLVWVSWQKVVNDLPFAVNGTPSVGMQPNFWRLASAAAQKDMSVVIGTSLSTCGVGAAPQLQADKMAGSISNIDFILYVCKKMERWLCLEKE